MTVDQVQIKLDVVLDPGSHQYWSTACRHDHHDYCAGGTRLDGKLKLPARCKFCDAPCLCTCHQEGS